VRRRRNLPVDPLEPVSLLGLLLEVEASGDPAIRAMAVPDFNPLLDEMSISIDCDSIDGIQAEVRLTIRFSPRRAQMDVLLERR
jgi:hypothetical protein